MKSDLTRQIAIQMTRQSELVKFQVASQSDDKHVSEVHQKRKGKANPKQKPVRNWDDRSPRNNPPSVPCPRRNRLHKQEDVSPAMEKNLLQIWKQPALITCLFAIQHVNGLLQRLEEAVPTVYGDINWSNEL